MDAMGVLRELSEGAVGGFYEADVCAMRAGAVTELERVPKRSAATVRWQVKVKGRDSETDLTRSLKVVSLSRVANM